MKMPLMLEVKDKKILVVGGGTIGFRKALSFLSYEGNVTCLSLSFLKDFEETTVECIVGPYDRAYISSYDIIVAATENHHLNGEIYHDAQELKKLCMTVDAINPSDFDHMAVKRKGDLTIAVSTQGGSPMFSKKMVQTLMAHVSDDELNTLASMVEKRRRKLNKENEKLYHSN